MREIKFRAWHKYANYMCQNATTDFLDRDYLEFMQYTGLKDKNGKEIYEGDIIEGGYLNPLTEEFASKKYIVEFRKASFVGKLIGHSPYGDTWLNFIQGEVIGNVYENIELMEV